jgi:sugar phosphate isomerase/epimerase
VSFHAGFLPHHAGRERDTLIARMREMVDRFAAEGVRVAFETGQESAETLLAVLQELERPQAGVNFDPANLILYGMDEPLDALARLAPFVRQVHIKDAIRTRKPLAWGQEVVVGTGEVDWNCFFDILREHRLDVELMIEREAGSDRVGDIRVAAEFVKRAATAWGIRR